MAAPVDASIMKDALVVLGAAGIVVPLGHRLKVSPIIAFLIAGVVLGPHGLGALSDMLPAIGWVTIKDNETLSILAELGVAFLLFVIGLELSPARLMTMRRLVFGLGSLQVLVCGVVIGGIASQFVDASAALVLGAGLALSSTAIVIEVLSAEKRVASTSGRVSFAVLLLQDLAVIPLMFVVGTLGDKSGGSLLQALLIALAQALLTIVVIVGGGRFLLRPLFRLVAASDNRELFMAATLFVAIGTGVLTAAAGMSMALGAFIAGLLLAETEYRRAIETTIEPFKSLLLGVFFFSVGMSLDLAVVAAHPFLVVGALLGLMLIKGVLILALGRLYRLPRWVSIEVAALLAPAGEFAFVIFALAASTDVLTPEVAALAVATASLSMATIPLTGAIGRRIGKRYEPPSKADAEADVLPPEDKIERTIIVGYGRVGRLVAEMLERHEVSYLAVDADSRGVAKWRRDRRPVFWGDATDSAFLERCGLAEAAALVVTIDNPRSIEKVVTTARALRPDIVIVARSRDAEHARILYSLGVTDAVPETIEASLQLSEAALAGLGIAAGPVIASIHERRDEFRRQLQNAAGRPTRAMQPSRRRLIGAKIPRDRP